MADELLKKVANFIDEVNKQNSKKYKEEVIKKYKDDKDMCQLFKYMFSPFITLGVTEAYLTISTKETADTVDLLLLLKLLSGRNITGHKAAAYCQKFLEQNKANEATFKKILNRDLKIGIQAKTMHEIFPNLIPLFEVSLATDIKKVKQGLSFLSSKEHLLMRKLDGVRCITFVNTTQKQVTHFSRKGQKFTSLSKLSEALLEALPEGQRLFLVGEICVIDDGKENFKEACSKIRRQEEQMENPHYVLFDCLSPTEFLTGTSERTYSERLAQLKELFTNTQHFSVIEAVSYNKENHTKLWNRVIEEGWEGLIARADVPYKSGRSKDLLKLKVFEDAEFEVVSLDQKLQGVLVNGQIVQTPMVGALVFKYKNNEVKCGTGFTQEEAIRWWKHPEEIVGKTVTIQYQGESQDKDGKPSLRIPSFKGIRNYEKEE